MRRPAPRSYTRAIPSGVKRTGSDRSGKKPVACGSPSVVSSELRITLWSGMALRWSDEREEREERDCFSGSQMAWIFAYRGTGILVPLVPLLPCETGLRPPIGGKCWLLV